jgi:hypothetical protein
MENQPTPPTEDSKTHLEKLRVERDNALLELNTVMMRAMAQALAICRVDMQPGAAINLHADPGNLSQIIATLMQQMKSQQIILETLVDMMFDGVDKPMSASEFMARQTKAATATASLITRGLLSQGGQKPSIIRPA